MLPLALASLFMMSIRLSSPFKKHLPGRRASSLDKGAKLAKAVAQADRTSPAESDANGRIMRMTSLLGAKEKTLTGQE